MLPATAGARPGKMNMMFLPNSANSRLLPDRNPSPTPTSSSSDPTPQAIPNIVRNDRNLWVHKLRMICAKMSQIVRILVKTVGTFNCYTLANLNFRTIEGFRLASWTSFPGVNFAVGCRLGARGGMS
jgi:hypothetical protein